MGEGSRQATSVKAQKGNLTFGRGRERVVRPEKSAASAVSTLFHDSRGISSSSRYYPLPQQTRPRKGGGWKKTSSPRRAGQTGRRGKRSERAGRLRKDHKKGGKVRERDKGLETSGKMRQRGWVVFRKMPKLGKKDQVNKPQHPLGPRHSGLKN